MSVDAKTIFTQSGDVDNLAVTTRHESARDSDQSVVVMSSRWLPKAQTIGCIIAKNNLIRSETDPKEKLCAATRGSIDLVHMAAMRETDENEKRESRLRDSSLNIS